MTFHRQQRDGTTELFHPLTLGTKPCPFSAEHYCPCSRHGGPGACMTWQPHPPPPPWVVPASPTSPTCRSRSLNWSASTALGDGEASASKPSSHNKQLGRASSLWLRDRGRRRSSVTASECRAGSDGEGDASEDDLPPWLTKRSRPLPVATPCEAESSLPDVDWLVLPSAEEMRREELAASPSKYCRICESIYKGAVCGCSQLWTAHPINKIIARTLPLEKDAVYLGPASRALQRLKQRQRPSSQAPQTCSPRSLDAANSTEPVLSTDPLLSADPLPSMEARVWMDCLERTDPLLSSDRPLTDRPTGTGTGTTTSAPCSNRQRGNDDDLLCV